MWIYVPYASFIASEKIPFNWTIEELLANANMETFVRNSISN